MWISRVLPWVAFVVALGFAFVQLAARHQAERQVAGAPTEPGPRGAHAAERHGPGLTAPTAAAPRPHPVAAPLPALEPLLDWTVGERKAARLAVLKARVEALQRAQQTSALAHAEREAALLAERGRLQEQVEARAEASRRLERELAGANDPVVAIIQDAASGEERRVAAARRYASKLSPLAVRRLRLKLRAAPRLAIGLQAMLSAFPQGRETEALRDSLRAGPDSDAGSGER